MTSIYDRLCNFFIFLHTNGNFFLVKIDADQFVFSFSDSILCRFYLHLHNSHIFMCKENTIFL